MDNPVSPPGNGRSRVPALGIETVCLSFAAAWKAGERPQIEQYLKAVAPNDRGRLLREILSVELAFRRKAGEMPLPEEYLARFPDDAGFIVPAFREPSVQLGDWSDQPAWSKETVSLESGAAARDDVPPPAQFGRYRIVAQLGVGSFGIVYKAYDEELRRDVAIKVPHRHRVNSPEDVEIYLTEARILASLDHPGIVPVYDIGRTEDGLCYVVSKFIEGTDLRRAIAESRPSISQAAEFVVQVAEALHHAHERGLVHRDIKPANILLDTQGKPVVADFGLALREEDFGTGSAGAGTPAYMSPEQARGEGHLVDARSDVYCLGVVLYELLTGQRPFQTATRSELLQQIATREPRPPRQIDAGIPRELDRICLKALGKRASDRYSTALDLAEDLRHWQGRQRKKSAKNIQVVVNPPVDPVAAAPSAAHSASDSMAEPGKVVPRGLRSFDADDADFFLRLVPGPRDRDGLPECIRFWKLRIENTDPEKTFRVGLIYGPSGGGKSSLVKAGLLPRLAKTIFPVYLEATPELTEARLLKGLRNGCAGLPDSLDLVQTMAGLRRGRGLPAGKKLLIILDQFEQWLHAKRSQSNSELVRALRHCDGQHLQCLVLVRDDFGMAAARFMEDLEIPIVQGENFVTSDLFDPQHARKVLAEFGRAFGQLPDSKDDLPPEQVRFLDRAVEGLAEDGNIIPVRLALFAEMVRDKPWTNATLKAVGGAQGIGVAFLDDIFASRSANPRHLRRQKSAQAVLRALLPEHGSDIKGHMRSEHELREAAGYAEHPKDFGDLMKILDTELRLVTPTDPESAFATEAGTIAGLQTQKYYQLTHDYLVPSLREWLTRRQRETWRGRAELRLDKRAAQWSQSHESRFLPSLPEYFVLSLGVPRHRRKPQEQALLRAAARYHTLFWGIGLAVLLLAGFAMQQYVASIHRQSALERANTLVESALNASPSDVPLAIEKLKLIPDLAMPLLRQSFGDERLDASRRLHAAFALAALGEVHSELLLERMASASPSEARNLIAALAPASESTSRDLLEHVQNARNNADVRARFGITLLQLGDPRGARLLLALAPDPTNRTAFIHQFATWHGDLAVVADSLQPTEDAALQSGLCAGVGLVEPDTLGHGEQQRLQKALEHIYRDAREGGPHSAAGWALQRWTISLPRLEPSRAPILDRRWFINAAGITMLEMQPGSFRMGDPLSGEDAKPHDVRLSRNFFLSDREVSQELFLCFMNDPAYQANEKPEGWTPDHLKQFSPNADCPVQQVSWFDAVLFCNWLSLKEGRDPCYHRTGARKKVPLDKATTGWDIWRCDPSKNGYRLPTEAEWEYGCRSGTTTAYSFGNDPQRLSDYGIFLINSGGHSWPARTMLPNSWGLFDMHGNIAEWCSDWDGPYEKVAADPLGPSDGLQRVFRGGHFYSAAREDCRSGKRYRGRPTDRLPFIGFRVACGE